MKRCLKDRMKVTATLFSPSNARFFVGVPALLFEVTRTRRGGQGIIETIRPLVVHPKVLTKLVRCVPTRRDGGDAGQPREGANKGLSPPAPIAGLARIARQSGWCLIGLTGALGGGVGPWPARWPGVWGCNLGWPAGPAPAKPEQGLRAGKTEKRDGGRGK